MSRKIKIALLGSNGKMGLHVQSLLKDNKSFEAYLEITSKKKSKLFKKSFATLKSAPDTVLKDVDVWIDFSTPKASIELIKTLHKYKTAVISGTTGFTPAEFKTLSKYGQKAAFFWASNMSSGLWAVRQALKALKYISDFDVCVDEIHHTEKKDNPSGTAVTLHHDLETLLKRKIKTPHGQRIGRIYGIHTVTAASHSELIKIEHQALSRSVFAEGALKAALWIVKQPAGLYNMDHLMMRSPK